MGSTLPWRAPRLKLRSSHRTTGTHPHVRYMKLTMAKGSYIELVHTLLFLKRDLKPSTQSDISRLEASEVARHRAEMWLLSPSCQPYTVLNPEAAGADDPRAASFIHLFSDVLPEIHSNYKTGIPRWLLIENVAGFEVCTLVWYEREKVTLHLWSRHQQHDRTSLKRSTD